MGTRVTGLIQEREGAVTGVELIDGEGREFSAAGKNVVLASGGYAANPVMFRRLCGYRMYVNGAYEYAQGDGYDLAVSAGGYLRGRGNYLSNFGWLLEDGPYPKAILGRINTYPDSRPPWEIYVNARGERFVREDEPSIDVREHALLGQPDLRYWIVFDDEIFRQAPPMVYEWTREQMAEAFNAREAFRKADSLPALAERIGAPADALAKTVAEFNAGVAEGRDALGRAHLPSKIEKPPYYAIRQQGGSLSSSVGVAVNEKPTGNARRWRGGSGPLRSRRNPRFRAASGQRLRWRNDGHALHRFWPFAWTATFGVLMRRRTVIGGLIGGALAGRGNWIGAAMAEEGNTVITNTARYAGVGKQWAGARALAGGKGYAPCRLGALHYRRLDGRTGERGQAAHSALAPNALRPGGMGGYTAHSGGNGP